MENTMKIRRLICRNELINSFNLQAKVAHPSGI